MIRKYFKEVVTPYIIDNPSLRAPQCEAWCSAYDFFVSKENTDDAIIIVPTGVGKTGIMGLLPYGIAEGRVLILTPQLTVKDSVLKSLDSSDHDCFWLKRNVFSHIRCLPKVIEFEGAYTKPHILKQANIVITNIHKTQERLTNSITKVVPPNFFDMIIVDEAHHSTADSWQNCIEYFSDAKVIKLTGTPFRSDGCKINGKKIYEYKLRRAMSEDYVKSLKNIEYCPDELYFTLDKNEEEKYSLEEIMELNLKDSDWISRSVAYSEECSQSIVSKSTELLEDQRQGSTVPHKIIAVACSIHHAQMIQKLYDDEGLRSCIIHSKLNDELRTKAFNDIENNCVDVVINVAMLGEGYDHKYLSIAAIFRPFRSELPYQQFVGRVLRRIPDNEVCKPTDNIASIVSHEHLYLQDLWDNYKKEKRAAHIIRNLDNSYTDPDSTPTTRNIDAGNAIEFGNGTDHEDIFLSTKLIESAKEEEKNMKIKIAKFRESLGTDISDDKLKFLIQQIESDDSKYNRPDLMYRKKRTDLDVKIKTELIPSLFEELGISPDENNLCSSLLFKSKYKFILKTPASNKNDALIAFYCNCYLKNKIGKARKEWNDDELNRAHSIVDSELYDFLKKSLS